MKFYCDPDISPNSINTSLLAKYIQGYAVAMAPILKVSPTAILKHCASMSCELQSTFVVAFDTCPNSIIGCHVRSEQLRISVLGPGHPYILAHPSAAMIVDGQVNILKTAFLKELHNAILYRFKGYKLAFADNCISASSQEVQKLLGVSRARLHMLKKIRARYDLVFENFKTNIEKEII